MEATLLGIVLHYVQDNVSDVVFGVVLALLVFFQFMNWKYSKRSAKSCEFTNERLTNTIPSVSRRIIDVVKNSASINRELNTILDDLEADRAYVYMFHNSGYDFMGQPFAKITNTNESVREGFASCMEKMKDIPIGIMANFVDMLLTNKEVHCRDVDIYKDTDKTAYAYLYNLGIRSTYTVAIFAPNQEHIRPNGSGRNSLGDVPIGFVGIDYLRDKRSLEEDELQKLHDRAMIIKGLLLERRSHEIERIRKALEEKKREPWRI